MSNLPGNQPLWAYAVMLVMIGFLVGLGFQFADQLTWMIFDAFKEKHGLPLGSIPNLLNKG